MVIYRSYGRLRDPAVELPTPRRDFSRVTGHHNAIDEDPSFPSYFDFSVSPPSYRTATLRPNQLPSHQHTPNVSQPDSLPQYDCTVELEGPAGIKYEQTSPFESLEDREWADVYLKLHGTCLSIHQLGTVGKFSKALGSPKPDWPGRLIKRYTLQQAEAGLASDAPKHELVPSTLAAALWPHSKLKRLQEESPQLFDHIRQYVIRLRVESEQFVIRFKKWEDRALWIDQLCKAIDIASPLEYRTEPKYHTLPRRRRQRPARVAIQINPLANMSSLIEEQERIMRERFPHLLGNNAEDSEAANNELADVAEDSVADPEAEDLDNAVVMGDSNGMQRAHSRAQADGSQELLDQTLLMDPSSGSRPLSGRAGGSLPSSNDPGDKLVPAVIDANQALRWRRRCMPTLLYTSRRCDDIIIKSGKLWKIDWDAKVLKPYPEPPPHYEPPVHKHPLSGANKTDIPVDTASSSAIPSARASESQPRTLRPTPSTTTVDDSADSSLNTVDSYSNPSTGTGTSASTTGSASNRHSKIWGEMKGWGKRMRKSSNTSRGQDTNEAQQQQQPNPPSNSEHLLLHKIGHDDAAEESFGEDTLRMLGIQ